MNDPKKIIKAKVEKSTLSPNNKRIGRFKPSSIKQGKRKIKDSRTTNKKGRCSSCRRNSN